MRAYAISTPDGGSPAGPYITARQAHEMVQEAKTENPWNGSVLQWFVEPVDLDIGDTVFDLDSRCLLEIIEQR
jgi:hypothetical protein